MLTVGVLAIFLTAPLGGIAMSLLGPVLLTKEEHTKEANDAHPDGPSVELVEESNRKYDGDYSFALLDIISD